MTGRAGAVALPKPGCADVEQFSPPAAPEEKQEAQAQSDGSSRVVHMLELFAWQC